MSGASSMRNAIKRVTHKERAQPSWRKKLGFLEKHKDYIVRAKDYHKKQDYLKKLKQKASERNSDEFYFRMKNSEVAGGVHKSLKGVTSLDVDTAKLLKSQDMGYLIHKKCVDNRKVEKLQSNLHLIGERRSKSHTLFVDNEEEVEKFDAAIHFGTVPELVERAFNRPKIQTIEDFASKSTLTSKEVKLGFAESKKSYKELQKRLARGNKIERVRQHLQTQLSVMGKGSKRKVKDEGEDGAPAVYKWKRQRCA